jgi:adenine-specific DNA-methyltransferase
MPFLDWVNKNHATQVAKGVPYHLLRQVSEHGLTEGDAGKNLLIQGDNLAALKALKPLYEGRVKCIFIDPPYNTQSAFEHYDDKLEHSQWLSMMYPRLSLLRDLLSEDGSIWVTLDDNEAHYCKVLMDEVLGRQAFITNAVWQKRTSPDARLQMGDAHDHLLVFGKKLSRNAFNKLGLSEEQKSKYKNFDNDTRGNWVSSDYSAQGYRPNQMYPITTPAGVVHFPPKGSCWKNTEEKFLQLVAEGRFWFGKDGRGVPRRKNYLTETDGRSSWSWWTNAEVGHNQEAKKEIIELFGLDDVFSTPKPERLIQRILQIATNPGDLVLDSFLGSGTTAAVAHKMGRRYIGIEMGDHAETHCLPRLQKVIEGEQGGISKAVGWQGGGGFRFCKLGPPVFDEYGAIHPDVKFSTLAGYLWHFETGCPGKYRYTSPFLGVHNGTAYYLLFNGILGDRQPQSGNVLTHAMLQHLQAIHEHSGPKVVYGEMSRIGSHQLTLNDTTFKQIPYDIPMR